MIEFSPAADGSGVVTGGGRRVAFAAGITPADLLAMHLAAQPAPGPTPLAVSVTVPALAPLQTEVQNIAAYLPQLQAAVAKIPGAVAIPPAPVAVAIVSGA